MKQIDFEKPSQSLDQVYLGCTQREKKLNKSVIEEHKHMFESRTSARTIERLPGSGDVNAKRQRGPTTQKDMRRNS